MVTSRPHHYKPLQESGKRDSTPRPQPWQGCALPTELFPRTNSRSTHHASHGGEGNRTPDLLNAIQALSQLSYTPGITLAVPTTPDRNREGYPRVVSMSRKSLWLKCQRPVSCSASIA